MSTRSIATAAAGSTAPASLQQPPAAAAAAGASSSISSQLRTLADQIDQGFEQASAEQIGQSLQALAQQLLSNSNIRQQESTGKAAPAAAVEALERSYAQPAVQPAAVQEQQRSHGDAAEQPRTKKQRRGDRAFDFSRYSQRYVALHLMYIGWSYQGLARQADSENTIEGVLFPALRRVKLIPEEAQAEVASLAYSRCGRTDKGVSALGQVLALRLRSSALAGQPLPPAAAELDYPSLLNKALPDTIRVLGWADAAPEFSARFDCRDRKYKYFMVQDGGLDLAAMNAAAQHLVGEHDFRNFCKADVAQVKNFRREVLAATIEPAAVRCPGMSVVALRIKGTAFLWHQVRCIAAVLLMVGRGQEQPCIVQQLLDISSYPCKPQYSLAAEEPLLLFACGFEGIQWQRSEANLAKCLGVVGSQLQRHLVAAALTNSVFEQLQQERAALLAGQQQQQQQAIEQQQGEHQAPLEAAAAAGAAGGQEEAGNGSSGLGAAGAARWLAARAPHILLRRRATEPSMEERFAKAGIPLELLNQRGLPASMQE